MAGKTTVKGELEEELIQAQCILSNFAKDINDILDILGLNEQLDHQNDKLRNEAMRFFLDALEAYNAKDYEGMQKFTHAGVQKLHEQAEIDFKDDKPRIDIKIKLTEVSIKATFNLEQLRKITAKISGVKNARD